MSKMSMAFAALGVVAGLGVAALPLGAHAATYDGAEGESGVLTASGDNTVKTTVKETLTLTLTSTDGTETATVVDLGELIPGGAIVSESLNVGVKTNNAGGYTVTLQDKDGTNDLENGAAKIPAGTPKVGTSAWGFKKGVISTADTDANASEAEADTAYGAVPVSTAAAATIVNSGKPSQTDEEDLTKDGDTVEIIFGASANSAQAGGTYSDIVVVTATANA